MIKNNGIRKSIVGVETAESLEQLKEGVLAVFKAIDEEIDYLVKNKVDMY